METYKIKGEDCYQCREVKAERDTLKAQLAELLEGYQLAIADIEGWASYAPEYFQTKHDLAGCISDHKKALAALLEVKGE